MKIKDLNNRDYEIKDLPRFINHIKTFHSHGTSVHEENGYWFRVTEVFYSYVMSL